MLYGDIKGEHLFCTYTGFLIFCTCIKYFKNYKLLLRYLAGFGDRKTDTYIWQCKPSLKCKVSFIIISKENLYKIWNVCLSVGWISRQQTPSARRFEWNINFLPSGRTDPFIYQKAVRGLNKISNLEYTIRSFFFYTVNLMITFQICIGFSWCSYSIIDIVNKPWDKNEKFHILTGFVDDNCNDFWRRFKVFPTVT